MLHLVSSEVETGEVSGTRSCELIMVWINIKYNRVVKIVIFYLLIFILFLLLTNNRILKNIKNNI